jgi:hypothetical protein
VKDLIAMRKFLPSQEYRLLKNRKSAKESRKKQKQERISISKQLEIALKAIEMMRERVRILEK